LYRSTIALLAILVLTVSSASAHADQIDQIVLSEMKRQFSPAVGIAVVKDGRAVKVKGYGLANVEHRAPATALTYFQTASVGKQFTASLVMLLVRDGRLKLDDPISKYLQGTPPSWQGITVRHLLTHTSGLDATDGKIDLRKDYTEQELLASAYKVPILNAPGKRQSYSNLGYQVLGFLCSSVGGKFWGEQLRERVFIPLGMSSRVISERDIVPNRAAGYDRFDGALENQAWVAPSQNTTADGSLYVTLQDMARWSVALVGQQLLTNEEKEAMWTPAALDDGRRVDYGFGWKLFTEGGHRLVRHRGDWQGFTTHIVHLPEDRLTISVLMNRARGQPHVIADRIATHYIPALRKASVVQPSSAILARTPMYVRGGMNNWRDTAPLLQVEPGLFQTRLTLQGGMQQFKIASADGKVASLGARFDEAVVRPDKVQFLEHLGEDFFLEVDKPGEYIFQLDIRGSLAPRLKVLPPSGPQPS
jgi:CubicO group peptidase (beta-lactamase class C family)